MIRPVPVVLPACFLLHANPWVGWHPAFLRPRLFPGDKISDQLGARAACEGKAVWKRMADRHVGYLSRAAGCCGTGRLSLSGAKPVHDRMTKSARGHMQDAPTPIWASRPTTIPGPYCSAPAIIIAIG